MIYRLLQQNRHQNLITNDRDGQRSKKYPLMCKQKWKIDN